MSALELPHPGLLIHDTVRLFRRGFGCRIQDLGLSEAQWRTLGTLVRSEGLSQSALAERLGIGKARLGNLVDHLERAGLVCRRPDGDDRRIKRLYLTPGAIPTTKTMRQRFQEFEREFMDGISPQREKVMSDELRRIYRNLVGVEAGEMSMMQLLTYVAHQFGRHFDEELERMGFTRSQWMVLVVLKSRQGVLQTELAEAVHMQKAPLGALVDELEQGGWVERRQHPDDRRARRLFLTRRCSRHWDRLEKAYEVMHRKALAGVTEAGRRELREGLYALRDNLQSIATGIPT